MKELIEFRRSKGLTQKEMADKIGTSKRYYEDMEYSDKAPSRSFLEKLKSAYPDVDINIFFGQKFHGV